MQLCEPNRVNLRALAWLTTFGRIRYSSSIVILTAAYLVIGIAAFAAWRITSNDAWVESFFRIPGALLSLFLASVQLCFSLRVLRHFLPHEAMHRVWLCIAGSAAFDLAGTIFSQILSAKTLLNPLASTTWWSDDRGVLLREYGLLLGGTCRFGLLAMALWLVLRIFRRRGLLARMKAIDWLVWAAMGAYVVREALDVWEASKVRSFPLVEIAGWPVDLLLLLLLAEATLLYRSGQPMRSGTISRCWNAIALGVLLVCVGVVMQWTGRYGFLPWPWISLVWYIWLPAGAAFALAPILQLEAIQEAYGEADGFSGT